MTYEGGRDVVGGCWFAKIPKTPTIIAEVPPSRTQKEIHGFQEAKRV
jgi:hypothetical protein